MCPLCIGTATLIVSGSSSAGGLAALLLRRAVRRERPLLQSETVTSPRPPDQARADGVHEPRAPR